MSVSFIDGHIDELKITDDGIIKALECYTKEKTLGECKKSGCSALTPQGCSYYLRTDDDFMGVIFVELIKDALDLINRQKAEIERLKKGINIELENYATEYDNKIKAEAVKEFAEKIFDLFPADMNYTTISRFSVRRLLKETVGDDK